MKGLPFGVGQFPFKPWLHPLLARHETHTRVSSPCYDIEGGEPGARLKFLIVSCRSLHSLMLAILTQLPPVWLYLQTLWSSSTMHPTHQYILQVSPIICL